jgi:hypothetical protein
VQALKALKARFASSPLGVPTDDEAQWFLRDRSFDVDEAYDKLRTCLLWRRDFGLQHITWRRVQREAATGKAYLHDHTDVHGRPVLVIRVARCALASMTRSVLTSDGSHRH